MKARFHRLFRVLALFAGIHQWLAAQLPVINSFSQNGVLVLRQSRDRHCGVGGMGIVIVRPVEYQLGRVGTL